MAPLSLILELPSIPEAGRRSEAEFWTEFEAELPGILGGLLETIAGAMHKLPKVHLERLPRMADFAIWGTAVERALRWPDGSFMEAYSANLEKANQRALDASNLVPVVLRFAESRTEWTGSMSDLLDLLGNQAGEDAQRTKWWPKTPSVLSGKLRRLAPNLRKTEVEVEFYREGKGRQRRVRISKVGKSASAPSAASASAENGGETKTYDTAGADALADALNSGSKCASATGPYATLNGETTSEMADAADAADALFRTTNVSDGEVEVRI